MPTICDCNQKLLIPAEDLSKSHSETYCNKSMYVRGPSQKDVHCRRCSVTVGRKLRQPYLSEVDDGAA